MAASILIAYATRYGSTQEVAEAVGARLRERGITEAQAAELRAHIETFAEDWNSPDMDLYDDYDAAKARLQTW